MNYRLHYNRLMDRAKERVLSGYRERHHIQPKCMGGGDNPENLVYLTGEEHYVAHLLLVKIYPKVKGLVVAAILQCSNAPNNKCYGWLKRKNSAAVSALLLGNTRRRGKKDSPETIEKKRISHIGKKAPPNRKQPPPATKEQRAKMSAFRQWRKLSEWEKLRIREGHAESKRKRLEKEGQAVLI